MTYETYGEDAVKVTRSRTIEALVGLGKRAKQIADSKGFEEKRTFGELIALMHSELSEALEEYRGGHPLDEVYFGEDGKPEGVPIELADCMIRIFQACATHNIPLASSILMKMDFNETRPHKHGGKLI